MKRFKGDNKVEKCSEWSKTVKTGWKKGEEKKIKRQKMVKNSDKQLKNGGKRNRENCEEEKTWKMWKKCAKVLFYCKKVLSWNSEERAKVLFTLLILLAQSKQYKKIYV